MKTENVEILSQNFPLYSWFCIKLRLFLNKQGNGVITYPA